MRSFAVSGICSQSSMIARRNCSLSANSILLMSCEISGFGFEDVDMRGSGEESEEVEGFGEEVKSTTFEVAVLEAMIF